MREGVKALGLKLYPDEQVFSETITGVKCPDGIADGDIRKRMSEKYGIRVAGPLPILRGKMFRIGHFGLSASTSHIIPTISALEASLAEMGYKFEKGAGIETARAILEEIYVPSRIVPPI
jgi:aspartate aminotransferase-like enzyme